MEQQTLDTSLDEKIRLVRVRTFFDNARGNPLFLALAGVFFVLLMADEGSPPHFLVAWSAGLLLLCGTLFALGRHVDRVGVTAVNADRLFFLRCVLGALVAMLFGATVVLLPVDASRTAYGFIFIITMSVVAAGYLAYATAYRYCLLVNVCSLLPLTFYCFYRAWMDSERFFILMGVAAIIWQFIFATKAYRVAQAVVGEIEFQEKLHREMGERRAAESALRASESRSHELAAMLRLMCDNVPDMIWAKDREGRYLFVNRAYSERMLGEADTATAVGKTFEAYVARERQMYPENAEWFTLGEFVRDIEHHALDREESTVYEESGNVRGKFIFLDTHLARFVNAQGAVIGTVGCARDITERKASEDYVQRLAYHDALTGLPNRVLLGDRLRQALAQAQRDRSKAAVLFIDLDRLKPVNDKLGHDAGDLLLQEVAQRLQAVVMRRADTVARLGGDEFVVLLQRINREQDAEGVAAKLLDELGAPFLVAGHELHIAASIGIAVYPSDGDDAGKLLKLADVAMYAAKRDGGNGYRRFSTLIAQG